MKSIRAAGAALIFMAACVWAQPEIRLKARSGQLRSGRFPRGAHYILQFDTYPGAGLREELASRGIRVLQYVPDNGLLVSSRPDADLSGLPVAGTGSLEAPDKISPLLARQVSGAVLAVFHSDVDGRRAGEIARLLRFDVIPNRGLRPNQLVLSGPLDRLSALAAFDEVSYVLPASPDLASGAVVEGCAGAITEAGPIGEYALVGRGWPKDSTGKASIGYVIRSLSARLDPAMARAEIERALNEWTRYADVSIVPGQPGAARTIEILFARGMHGDAYPFDGQGGILAHTFYPSPPNPEPVAGDMHLDADELWNIGSAIDVFSVALHEAGHALGLGHSDRPGAVMYPYYRQVTGLAEDDIAAIRALYGSAGPSSNPPPVEPPPVDPPPVDPPTQPPTQPPVTNPSAPPTIAITSPAGTIYSTTSAKLTISGTASHNVGVASVKWSTSLGDSGTATGTTAWSAQVPLLTGTTVVTVRAYDAAGNSAWRAITVVRR